MMMVGKPADEVRRASPVAPDSIDLHDIGGREQGSALSRIQARGARVTGLIIGRAGRLHGLVEGNKGE